MRTPSSSFRSSPLLSLASVPSLRSEARSRREKRRSRIGGEAASQGPKATKGCLASRNRCPAKQVSAMVSPPPSSP